jgi:hypothetical protein
MTKWGNVEDPLNGHTNHPMDAAFLGGHKLNESYKVPAANPQGLPNMSYMHPLGKNASRENAPTSLRAVAPKMVGKNPGKNAGRGPIT